MSNVLKKESSLSFFAHFPRAYSVNCTDHNIWFTYHTLYYIILPMNIGIVADSHSSLTPKEAERLGVYLLNTPFCIDGKDYFENVDITREAFFEMLSLGVPLSTSQPSPDMTMEMWDRALEKHDQILYMPISSGLSSTCQNAAALAEDEKYQGRVYVVDNGRVSTPMHCTILDALKMIEMGWDAPKIKEKLEKYRNLEVIYLAVDTLEYLKRGGRISSFAAAAGSILQIKPILKLDTGLLVPHRNAHGMQKARQMMIDTIKEDLRTRFADYYERGAYHLMTATSADPEGNENWIRQVKEAFPGVPVLSDYLSLGVCCHSGPGALGIGVSCKPV